MCVAGGCIRVLPNVNATRDRGVRVASLYADFVFYFLFLFFPYTQINTRSTRLIDFFTFFSTRGKGNLLNVKRSVPPRCFHGWLPRGFVYDYHLQKGVRVGQNGTEC